MSSTATVAPWIAGSATAFSGPVNERIRTIVTTLGLGAWLEVPKPQAVARNSALRTKHEAATRTVLDAAATVAPLLPDIGQSRDGTVWRKPPPRAAADKAVVTATRTTATRLRQPPNAGKSS
jgi:hypothetical protein